MVSERLHSRMVDAVRAFTHPMAGALTPWFISRFRCIVPAVSGTQLRRLAGPQNMAVELLVVHMFGMDVRTQLLIMTVLPGSTLIPFPSRLAPGRKLMVRTVTLVAHLFPLAIMAMALLLPLWNLIIPRLSVSAMLRLLNVVVIRLATAPLKPPVSG